MSNFIETNTETELISKSKYTENQRCFAISFFRPEGSTAFTVNSHPVEESKAYIINQPYGCIDTSKYHVVFDLAGVAADNACWVTRIVPNKK